LYKEFLASREEVAEKLKDFKIPHYHWTIRMTAKSRESKNSIMIAFYLTPQQEKSTIAELEADCMSSEKSNTVDSNSNYPSLIPNPSKSGGNILSLKRHAQPLKFHFLSEDELEEVPTQDDIGTTTNLASKAVGRQIKKWIHDCNEGHAKCVKAARTTWVPTRLLDLQFGDGTSVRLIDTRYEHTIGPYVTLSHCWGSDDLPETDA
jgi:hypothetical protein